MTSVVICIIFISALLKISDNSKIYAYADYKGSDIKACTDDKTPIIRIIDDIVIPNGPNITIEKIIDIDVKDVAEKKEEPQKTTIAKKEKQPEPAATPVTYNYDQHLLYEKGSIDGPSGKETYYSLPMDNIVDRMETMGFSEENGWGYWIREDGVKMLGNHVMVAANLDVHPRGSVVMTSVGPGIVCDTGDFAKTNIYQLDIATAW